MRRIDKRKWESKGLAYVYYEDQDGGMKKAKVDGMVYGQFREEDGAPAERLFRRILQNFSGELIELEGLRGGRGCRGWTGRRLWMAGRTDFGVAKAGAGV